MKNAGAKSARSRDWNLYASLFRGVPRWRLVLCASLAATQAAAVWLAAFLVRKIFDHALPSASLRGLLLAGAGVLAASLAQAGLTLAGRGATLDVVKRVIAQLRRDLVDRLLLLPRAFHLGTDRGVLHATVVQDTERLDDMSAVLITQFLPAIVSGLGMVAVLAWLHWPLCLALVASWPPLFFADRRLRDRLRGRVRAFHATFARYSQATLELLHRLDLTRMQSAETVETSVQHERIEALRREGGAVAWETTVHATGHEVLRMLTGLTLLLLGGAAVIRRTMTIGSLISFFFVARALGALLGQLFQLVPKVIIGQESLRSLAPLLSAGHPGGDPLLTTPPYTGKSPARFGGGIQFCDVTFSYPLLLTGDGAPAPVLREVRLSLVPGRTVALLGPNGAGKSTLLHLLLGFYRPTAGELLAGGEPYASLDMASLRAGFGVVPQTPVFFRGTVRENLTYGSPQAVPEGIGKALERAGAAAFVETLPQGLETIVGDDGTRLSGGQRQRLALARALLREPALLVLDEPTTHLDRAAVDTLVDTLRAVVPRPAVLIITHDYALIARCGVDDVYELHSGRLAPRTQGTLPAH